jgi:hypothetical protein
MTTAALPTTAPAVSVTVPEIVPLPLVWARRLSAAPSITAMQQVREMIRLANLVMFIWIVFSIKYLLPLGSLS